MHANELILMIKSQNELNSLFSRLEESLANTGLGVNEDKTKYMVVIIQNKPFLNIGQYNFERLKQLKYLRTTLIEKIKEEKKCKATVQAENKYFFRLAKLLGFRSLLRNLKKQLYTSLIRPIVKYGSYTVCNIQYGRSGKLTRTDYFFLKEKPRKNIWSCEGRYNQILEDE